VITGNLELLRGRVGEEARLVRLVEAAQQAAERGEKLTGQLLAFSRRQKLRPETVDVTALIRGFEALLHRAVGETVLVETRLGEQLWLAHLDAAQLESALLNLAVNARDAMPGGGTLTIETRNLALGETARPANAPPGAWIVIALRDIGEGMPPEVA